MACATRGWRSLPPLSGFDVPWVLWSLWDGASLGWISTTSGMAIGCRMIIACAPPQHRHHQPTQPQMHQPPHHPHHVAQHTSVI